MNNIRKKKNFFFFIKYYMSNYINIYYINKYQY